MTTVRRAPLRMQLNTFFSGPQAWFSLADERGYLREEGLEIEFTESQLLKDTARFERLIAAAIALRIALGSAWPRRAGVGVGAGACICVAARSTSRTRTSTST